MVMSYIYYYCIKLYNVLSVRCAIISYLGWQIHEISIPGLVFIAVELKRVPPCLPAVLQLRGCGLNLQQEKDDAQNYTAMVHSQDRGIQTLAGCLWPPEIVFSST